MAYLEQYLTKMAQGKIYLNGFQHVFAFIVSSILCADSEFFREHKIKLNLNTILPNQHHVLKQNSKLFHSPNLISKQ